MSQGSVPEPPMTPLQDATPFRAPPHYADSDSSIILPKQRASPASSLGDLPYRRSNPSLSALFNSTASLSGSRTSSGTATPTASGAPGSTFSPRSRLSGSQSPGTFVPGVSDEYRTLIQRAFVPHVAVLATPDAEDILQAKGFDGGLLQLLRPFGECVAGKVTIRDSNGAGRSWEDYGVRFVAPTDGLGLPARVSSDSKRDAQNRDSSDQGWPISRTGGNIQQIEELVDRHLRFFEFQTHDAGDSQFDPEDGNSPIESSSSPFYTLYIRRLLSALPVAPHETFAHPVACLVAISSRSADPLEDLRRLYARFETGDLRMPQWVGSQILRYYVFIHEEEHADISKSQQTFERIKRHYGLNCHLLRLKSSQCIPSDDDSVRLPSCEWISAGEELGEIQRRETADDITDPTPYLFESDVTAIRTFVRELVAQSVVPQMERNVTQWNDQVLVRRRGVAGRFMSLSKRWTPWTGGRTSSGSAVSNSNYDPVQGFYRPDTPEATLRKLADYSFMLRDYKLALQTYDVLRSDFQNDKAWVYYAGAAEMAALSALMSLQPTKTRIESIDTWLEAASYSYTDRPRASAPYYAVRALALGMELLRLRGSTAADDAARWASRLLESNLLGPVGVPLFTERASACCAVRTGVGSMHLGSRRRKAAFWSVLAAEQWLHQERSLQAEKCLDTAFRLYGTTNEGREEQAKMSFDQMQFFIDDLRQRILGCRLANRGFDEEAEEQTAEQSLVVEEVSETLDKSPRAHRKSLIGAPAAPIDVGPLSPMLESHKERAAEKRTDQFE